jgi:hypothetical protein
MILLQTPPIEPWQMGVGAVLGAMSMKIAMKALELLGKKLGNGNGNGHITKEDIRNIHRQNIQDLVLPILQTNAETQKTQAQTLVSIQRNLAVLTALFQKNGHGRAAAASGGEDL